PTRNLKKWNSLSTHIIICIISNINGAGFGVNICVFLHGQHSAFDLFLENSPSEFVRIDLKWKWNRYRFPLIPLSKYLYLIGISSQQLQLNVSDPFCSMISPQEFSKYLFALEILQKKRSKRSEHSRLSWKILSPMKSHFLKPIQ
ncbi:MAG: hypothetical protein JWQ35_2109, partial [Bacteriovoracaceae bacterium]|nr:hypothetical protein [Bacteriovoracaceae bacterium]